VLEKDPENALARVGLASVHLASSQYVKAMEQADEALEKAPELAAAHELRAALLAIESRHEESLESIIGPDLHTDA